MNIYKIESILLKNSIAPTIKDLCKIYLLYMDLIGEQPAATGTNKYLLLK